MGSKNNAPEVRDDDIRLVNDLAAASQWGEGVAEKWLRRIERKGSLTPKMREKARKILSQKASQGTTSVVKSDSKASEDRALVEAAIKTGDPFAKKMVEKLRQYKTFTKNQREALERIVKGEGVAYDPERGEADARIVERALKLEHPWVQGADLEGTLSRHGSLSKAQREVVWTIVKTNEAKGEADLREIIAELYPDAGVNLGLMGWQSIRPVWRSTRSRKASVCGPDAENGSWVTDHALDESFSAYGFLRVIANFSHHEAENYLMFHAGLAEKPPEVAAHVRERAHAAKEMSEAEKAREARKAAWVAAEKAKHREHAVFRRIAAAPSAYLRRKHVEQFGQTHWIRGGVRYAHDSKGRFLQVEVATFTEVKGLQRLYDGHVLINEDGERRDKDFLGDKKGGFVAVLPNALERLPKDAQEYAALLKKGYHFGVCEGLATALSACLANPKLVMFCALDAGNLVNVCEAIRVFYGDEFAYVGDKVKLACDIWRDDDVWLKDSETKEKTNVKKPAVPTKVSERNTGKIKAEEAAKAHRMRVLRPVFSRASEAKLPTDFNDLHCLEGLDALRLEPTRSASAVKRAHEPERQRETMPSAPSRGEGRAFWGIAALLFATLALGSALAASLGLALEGLSLWQGGSLVVLGVLGALKGFDLLLGEP